jgi:hypothetical protein
MLSPVTEVGEKRSIIGGPWATKSISLSKRPLVFRLMGPYADVVEGRVRYLRSEGFVVPAR